jgi:lipoyl(octanoyl) transferase
VAERRAIEIVRLGRIRYADAMALMDARVKARLEKSVPDALFLLEHGPVLTMGRRANEQNIKMPREYLAQKGVEVFETGRGGDVTYHGPGQIVGYPVLDLKPDRCDVRRYVADLEEVMIRAAAAYGITAGRVAGLIGAWVDSARKVGAIGVRISHWVTSHGFALNVATDLSAFDLIVPCGIKDKGVTSISKEAKREVTVDEAMDVVEAKFLEVFDAVRAPHAERDRIDG